MATLFRPRKPDWPGPRVIDAAIAVALLGIIIEGLALRPLEAGAQPATVLAYVTAAAFSIPFAVHRRYPRIAVAVTAVAVIVYSSGHFNGFPGWSTLALILAVTLHHGRRHGIEALVAGLGSMFIALLKQPEPLVTTGTWISLILACGMAWLVGETLRNGRDRWSAAEERAQRLEFEREERARQAVAEERLRIARELHDVVAHSMSVIAVQAGVANHVIDSRPELAQAALATVETASRSALVEMRRLLGVLRQGDEPQASLSPAPGLIQIPQLVSDFGRAGLEVRVTLNGETETGIEALPAGVDLSAYRIVQEALTNVLRHGGPRADVVIDGTGSSVTIDVTDPGRSTAPAMPGSGHGLIGMRERVAVFGGTLAAGPGPGGGFRVSATLPFAPAPQPDTARRPDDARPDTSSTDISTDISTDQLADLTSTSMPERSV